MSACAAMYEEVVATLGPEIVNGEVTPGTVLNLAGISQRFEVSRTVARESMRLLETLNLVKASRRVGIMVQDKTYWNVFDPRVIRWRLEGSDHDEQLRSLTQLRLAIEPQAAGAAARYATRSQRSELVKIAKKMRQLGEAGRLREFMEVDIRFHSLILAASGNEMFAAIAPVIGAVLQWRTELELMPPQPEPRALDDHELIAAAIASARPEIAQSAMRDLVDEVQEAFDSHMPNVLTGNSSAEPTNGRWVRLP